MATVVHLPEKRGDADQDQIPEKSSEKRLKLDLQSGEIDDTDIAMELESNSKSQEEKSSGVSKPSTDKMRVFFCMICDANGNHRTWDCPDKARGTGMGCIPCLGPCKKAGEHEQFEMIKFCVTCCNQGSHWTDECLADKDQELSDGDHDYYF